MSEWPKHRVDYLQEKGILFVEDGNHGEYRPRQNEFQAHGTPFIRAADMDAGQIHFDSAQRINDVALKRIRKGFGRGGDVLFSHKGTVGKLALAPNNAPPFVCSPQTTFWRVVDEERLDRRFLYYYMQSEEFTNQWNARKAETDMADYVSLSSQRELTVALPDMHVQRHIGNALGSLDDKIALNRRMNRTLENMAVAVFKSWFVEFDPVVAKAAGRKPYGMDDAIAVLFPNGFEDSGVGPIPKSWHTGSVYAIAHVTYGAPFASGQFNSEGIGLPLIRIRDLGDQTPSIFTNEMHPKGTVIHAGDILVGMDGDFPVCIWSGSDAWLNQRVCTFVPKADVSRCFVYLAIRDPMADFERENVGTTVNHLGKSDIDRIKLVLPPEPLMLAFKEVADPLLERIVQNSREVVRLAAMRDGMLPELFSGEIRVAEVERQVDKVL